MIKFKGEILLGQKCQPYLRMIIRYMEYVSIQLHNLLGECQIVYAENKLYKKMM
jgi:hypothetical protein